MSHNTEITNIAANKLKTFAAKSSKYNVIKEFHDKLDSIMIEYHKKYSVLSSISIHLLDSLQDWLPDLANNKMAKTIFVSNMLQGDIYSINVYDTIYTNQPELLVGYDKIHNDEKFKAQFRQYDGAEDARAIVTALHWLESEEAVNTVAYNQEGKETLCLVIDLLDINNNFLNCSDCMH